VGSVTAEVVIPCHQKVCKSHLQVH
jgi:hypothetical protein